MKKESLVLGDMEEDLPQSVLSTTNLPFDTVDRLEGAGEMRAISSQQPSCVTSMPCPGGSINSPSMSQLASLGSVPDNFHHICR